MKNYKHSGLAEVVELGKNKAKLFGETADLISVVSNDEISLARFRGSDAINDSEFVTKQQLDNAAPIQTIKYRKTYTSEQNGSSNVALSWGNGSSSQNSGAVISENGVIVSVSISTDGSATGEGIAIEVNNVVVGSFTHVGKTSVNIESIIVNSGDFLNIVRTSSGGGGGIVATTEVESEMNITAFRGEKGELGDTGANGSDGVDGLSVQTSGAGVPVDPAPLQASYLNTLNGDIYQSGITNSWTLVYTYENLVLGKGKFRSSIATSVDSVVDVKIPFNILSGVFDSPIFEDTTDIIKTVLQGGRYEVYSKVSVNGTTGNYRWTGRITVYINGLEVRSNVGGYIRSNSGANDTTLFIKETFNFTADDTIEIAVRRISTTSGNAVLIPDEAILEITKVS